MIRYIGIDLGQKGSISVQTKGPRGRSLKVHSFWGRHGGTKLHTLTNPELHQLISSVLSSPGTNYLCIESPIVVRNSRGLSSMFFYYGFVLACLQGFPSVQFICMTPTKWKAIVKAPGSDKQLMVGHATRLFPNSNQLIDKETADSVLISEACRLYYEAQME